MSKSGNSYVDELVKYLVLVLIGLPLFFIPSNIDLSYALRTGILITLTLCVLVYAPLRRRMLSNFLRLSKIQQMAVMVMAVMVVTCSLLSHASRLITVLGYRSDYLGLPFWLSCGILALTIGASFWQHLKSASAAYIVSASSLLALLTYSYSYSWLTDRLGGVFFLATNSGVWASIGIILTYEFFIISTKTRDRIKWLALCLLNAVPVILSESRIAFIICILYLILVIVRRNMAPMLKIPLLIGGLISVGVLRILNSLQTTPQDITSSMAYRLDLYRTTLPITTHHIVGVGPSAGDTVINSIPHLPAALAKTLKSGYVFLYAHNLLIDIGLMFGFICMLALLYIIAAFSIKLLSLRTHPMFWLMATISLALLANAMVNVPNNVLTCLLFVAIFAVLLSDKQQLAKQKLQGVSHQKRPATQMERP